MRDSTHPQWIAKMYTSKTGRDHLGLGSVSSDQILPFLSPGINVLTTHPRYHSFYVFLLDEFWQLHHVQSSAAWIEFFRPRDFLFSIGVFLCDCAEHGKEIVAVGKQKTAPLAAQQLPAYDYRAHPNYIDERLGGYGLYYRSVMAELGLIYPGGPGLPLQVDIPTEFGKQVAASFRQAVQKTEYYQNYFATVEAVPRKILVEYIRCACLCQLQVFSAPDRPLLLKAFLHGGSPPVAQQRRATFQLFLDIADQTLDKKIDQGTYRQLLYFQSAGNGATYHPQPKLEQIYQHWRLYQAREYYAFALNALWKYLCTWGINVGGDYRPVPLELFWQHLDTIVDFDRLASRLHLPMPGLKVDSSYEELLHWLLSIMHTDQSDFDAACTLSSPIHEHLLYDLLMANQKDPQLAVMGMITLLSLIYLRFSRSAYQKQPAWLIASKGEDSRLSLANFIEAIRYRFHHSKSSIEDVLRWLYEHYIIRQHIYIAEKKLPENTFRFQREGNALRFFNLENSLDFTDSRFYALSTTLYELGLCGYFLRPPHRLTTDGQQLLTEGDLL